jgi:hypothetical protein
MFAFLHIRVFCILQTFKVNLVKKLLYIYIHDGLVSDDDPGTESQRSSEASVLRMYADLLGDS